MRRTAGVRRLQNKLSNCEGGLAAEKDAAAESRIGFLHRCVAVERGGAGQSAQSVIPLLPGKTSGNNEISALFASGESSWNEKTGPAAKKAVVPVQVEVGENSPPAQSVLKAF